jgi:UDP-N-acetylglucosamine acyltransferase
MVQDRGRTTIGSHCLLMAYVHVGHDCILGDHVIMANNASVSGHVRVGDHANFGGYSGIAQFRNVGAYTHIAAMSLVIKDVPAYLTVGGNPAVAIGLNVEGMKRRGYDAGQIRALQGAYRIVYRSALTVSEALEQLAALEADDPRTALFAASIRDSNHGIVRPRRESASQA